ncbi:MAG TPA: hypothetical protein VJP40_02780, partial [bacterium]|nr:hypothetical protein [bacterium]
MISQAQQEKLVDDALRATLEAATLRDLGTTVLPLLEKTFDTSASLLYRFDSEKRLDNMAGSQVLANYEYYEEHCPYDPMQEVLHRCNPWIFHASRYPEWQVMLKSPVYEFCRRQEIENYFLFRLSETPHDAPGMTGIFLARSHRQPDFSEGEELLLARLLPSMAALTRRSQRLEESLRTHLYVQTMLERGGPPKLALDMNGALRWASEQALTALGLDRDRGPSIPKALVHAARQLRSLYGKSPGSIAFKASIPIHRNGNTPIRADLSIARTRDGGPFLIVELDIPGVSPQVR